MQYPEQLMFLPFRLDPVNEQLWRDEEVVALSPKPFAILRYLVEHAGRLVTKEELLKAVWPTTRVSDAGLKSYIHTLRDVLADNSEEPRFIETVARRGYRFLPAVTTAAPVSSCKLQVASSLPPLPFSAQYPAPTLVGREAELARLQDLLAKAMSGQRQLVFVTGEPGIGKTTLVEAFLSGVRSSEEFGVEEKVKSQKSKVKGQKSKIPDLSPAPSTQPLAPVFIGQGQCVEQYGAGEAYLPILEALGHLCRGPQGERLISVLRQHAPTWLVQMPALVSEADLEAIHRKVQGATRERMLREAADGLEVLTAERPLVLVLEDLHWSDHATVELLSLLARRREAARLLVLGTYRPAEVSIGSHPLKGVKQELHARGQCEEVWLRFLTAEEGAQYLAARYPSHAFPSTLAVAIHQSTDGNPLFVVNVVDDLAAQGVIAEVDGQWHLRKAVEEVGRDVPDSLRQLIAQHLERLPDEQQRLLTVASVVGTEFAAATVAAGLGVEVEQVEEWCEALVKRGQFLRAVGPDILPDGTMTGRYSFQHTLYQAILYEGMAAIQRVRFHRRVGEIEEQQYGERAHEIAAELSVHFDQGHDAQRAVKYLHRAAENAFHRYANSQAVTLLTRALELLGRLPESRERDQQELALQILLAVSFSSTEGIAAPEAEVAYTRAGELCRQIGDTAQLFPVLLGRHSLHTVRGELHTALEIIEQLLLLVQHLPEREFLVAAQSYKAQLLYYLGNSVAARTLVEEVVAFYSDRHQEAHALLHGRNPGVLGQGTLAWVLWILGYPDQALQVSQDMLAAAYRLAYGPSVMTALWHEVVLRGYRREWSCIRTPATELLTLSSIQGLPLWMALGVYGQGWALAGEKDSATGLTQMREGIAAYRGTGAVLGVTGLQTRLAERCVQAGLIAEGQALIADTSTLIERTEVRVYEAELYRLKGELMLQQANQKSKIKSQKSKTKSSTHMEVETYFSKAIDIAQQQQAKSLGLRATTSLARLWQSQGKTDEARVLLSDIYNWFTEGFDTADLQDAKALLEALDDPTPQPRTKRETPFP